MNAAQIQAIADAFDAGLRATLTAEEYADAIEQNRTEHFSGVCHTHDYCDANELMAAAFEKVTGREIDLQSDSDTALWNGSWNRWKSQHKAHTVTA